MLEQLLIKHFIAHVRTSKRINIGNGIIPLPDDLVVTVSRTLDGLLLLKHGRLLIYMHALEHRFCNFTVTAVYATSSKEIMMNRAIRQFMQHIMAQWLHQRLVYILRLNYWQN